MRFLDLFSIEDIALNDMPFIIKHGLEDPAKYAMWSDVEECMNNPTLYRLIDCGPHDDSFTCYDTFKFQWIPTPVIDKKHLFQNINNGNTLLIENYGFYNQQINDLLKELESRFFIDSAAHLYCGLLNSKSFPIHCDSPANFILQIEGRTRWTVFKQRATQLIKTSDISSILYNKNYEVKNDILLDTILEPGDVLYIPSRQYHVASPSEPRISISIPCAVRSTDTIYNRNYYKLNV
jgi:hypothetical protein